MFEINSEVRIPSPARYAVRLAKHFEHRLNVQRDVQQVRIEFPDAPCDIHCTGELLQIHIQSASAGTLARVRDVVARHLKQVASQEQFDIAWSGDLPDQGKPS